LTKFLPLLRQAVAVAPERSDLKLQLAKVLFQDARTAEIVEWLKPAVADEEVNPELLYCLGRAAMATCDYPLAFEALQSAGAKGFTRAFGYLAETLVRLDRADEALEAARRGLERSPMGFESLSVVAAALRDRGQVERLWALCRDLHARGAFGGWFSAVMASTAATLGHQDELVLLVDPARWFSATWLAVPDDFNQRLAAELLARKSPGARTRIDRLEAVGGAVVQDLVGRICHAVEVYLAERQVFSDHPMIANRPASVALNTWAIMVHDDKHHDWHIHRAGWISGVYYVTVPEVEPSDGASPGAIEFGLFPFGQEPEDLRSHRWQVTPKSGLLLLFPSYYAHRTWPTGIGDPRICVAFDIRPSDPAAGALSSSPA
jgi:uncharacterized protein (TIGR02466 family)